MRRTRPFFWTIVIVLVRTAWRRSAGRNRRWIRLNQAGRGGGSTALRVLFFAMVCVLSITPHFMMAIGIGIGVPTAEQIQAEARGRVVVEEWFAGRTENHEAVAAQFPERRSEIAREEASEIGVEATRLADRGGGDPRAIAGHLSQIVRQEPKLLLSKNSLWWQPGSLPDIFALIAVLWWALMLVGMSEGPQFNVQRPRHPMWEWLFSHPVPPSAVFLAEMVTPIAANPLYLTAPLLPALLYGGIFGWPSGMAAAVLVGIPAMLAFACLSKAIQIWIVLRLSSRTRGAALGLMEWLGFIAAAATLFVPQLMLTGFAVAGHSLLPLTHLPWPHARQLVGFAAAGHYDFWLGITTCWIVSATLIAAALALAVWSTRAGVVGRSAAGHGSVRVLKPARFRGASLYRKELLWLWRDRSALVQTILLPVSLAAFQVVGLHQVVSWGGNGWNTLCGLALLFGTYFLLTIGPRSLASEGSALWIVLTWPRGLESLLRAKARLWMVIASFFVALGLLIAAVSYPSDMPRILLVAVLWVIFGQSLAAKTTTLVTTVSSSGEPEKLPDGYRAAAMLGTLTFAIGIFTRQWNLAVIGVVYSVITASAMWQAFRYRLPCLLDPWSQTLPPPPTMLHATVAITTMVELVAVLSVLAVAFADRAMLAPINAGLYGVCAVAVAVGAGRFLAKRGLRPRDIWLWRGKRSESKTANVIRLIAGGAALGAALGGLGRIYLTVLHQFPATAGMLDNARRQMDALPHGYLSLAVISVAVAPFAEEFLFRGLLYRALDSEWGGWRAVVGAAVFFAVYHPALSWAPVAALGAMNAVIYKRTGHLAPAVAAHMAYNVVIVAFA